jgi:eukaryotic-like serine/threonine-protein kinase
LSGDRPLEPEAPTEVAAPRSEGTEPIAPISAAQLAPGSTLQTRFRIIRLIARGGMGEVYEAVDTALGTRVALKTVRMEQGAGEQALHRFRREILLARRIGHPNVCRVFELHLGGPSEPAAFLTMELLEGETLAERLRRDGPIPEASAREIVRQILSALAAAHAEGVIHRDLKASNVMLVPAASGGERVVVTDFGIAYALGSLSDSSATPEGVVGTPAYMAPEQVTGGTVSPATDLYGLGVVMFEMTSGRLPFAGATPQEVAARRLSGPSPRLSSAVPGVSRRWATLTAWCLEPQPGRRPPSAQAFAAALDRAPRLRVSRRTLGGLLLVCAGVALTFAVLGGRRPKPAATPLVRPVIAVLEAANLTGDNRLDPFSTAVSELLTSELEPIEGMRLVPARLVAERQLSLGTLSAPRYPIPAAPQRLAQSVGAAYLVEVTLQRGTGQSLALEARVRRPESDLMLASASASGRPDDPERAVHDLAEGLRGAMRWKAADPMLRSPMIPARPFPQDPEARRAMIDGIRSWIRRDFPEARWSFRRVLQREPAFLAAMPLLFDSEDQGRLPLSAEDGQRGLKLLSSMPDSPEKVALEAAALSLLERWDEAAERLGSLLESRGDDFELRLRRTFIAPVGVSYPQLELLRALPAPLGKDPRIELSEAINRETEVDIPRGEQAIDRGLIEARRRGDRLTAADLLSLRAIFALRNARSDQMVHAAQEAEHEALAAGSSAYARLNRLWGAKWLSGAGRSTAAAEVFRKLLLELPSLGEGWSVEKPELLFLLLVAESDLGHLSAVADLGPSVRATPPDARSYWYWSGVTRTLEVTARLAAASAVAREHALRRELEGCEAGSGCKDPIANALGWELLAQGRGKEAEQLLGQLETGARGRDARLYAHVMVENGKAPEAYAVLQPMMRSNHLLRGEIGTSSTWLQYEALAFCLVGMGELGEAAPLVARLAGFHRLAEPLWIRTGGLGLEAELAFRRQVVPPELPGLLQHEIDAPGLQSDPRARTELTMQLGRVLMMSGRRREAERLLTAAESESSARGEVRVARLARAAIRSR